MPETFLTPADASIQPVSAGLSYIVSDISISRTQEYGAAFRLQQQNEQEIKEQEYAGGVNQLVLGSTKAGVPNQRRTLETATGPTLEAACAALRRAGPRARLALLDGSQVVFLCDGCLVLDQVDEVGRDQHRDAAQSHDDGNTVVTGRAARLLEEVEDDA
jgi:hypothetical protein